MDARIEQIIESKRYHYHAPNQVDDIEKKVREAVQEVGKVLAETTVNAILQRNAISRDRAHAAGRIGVADCRQSDVETCEEIQAAILRAVDVQKSQS